MTPRVLVMIPTFNEQQHRRPVTGYSPGSSRFETLVVDDESPTGPQAWSGSARSPGLRLRWPPGRAVLPAGTAISASEFGASYLIEMDGDLSHSPRYIPALDAMSVSDPPWARGWRPAAATGTAPSTAAC